MEPLIIEILEDLTTELGLKEESDVAVLTIKVKNAVMCAKAKRDFPPHFTDEQIEKDLKKYYSNIHDAARIDYNQIGAEGQTSHSENGISRAWKDYNDCFRDIVAYCSVF